MRPTFVVLLAGAALLAGGCSPADDVPGAARSPSASSTTNTDTSPGTSDTSPGTSDTSPGRSDTSPGTSDTSSVRLRGIDASHHQGAIDWEAVAGDGVSFAYLKATEGTSYTDPTFAQHRAEALDLGLRVGGYHYFQLCSSGRDQAAHFAAVLGDLDGSNLPPAVDLELAGSCSAPPARGVLLAEVEAFLEQVEAMTGKEPVVYLYPEFEERFGFARDLGGYRQWVRSLDGPPDREWWMWQQTDSGSVDGIVGPVDVNAMWPREVVGR